MLRRYRAHKKVPQVFNQHFREGSAVMNIDAALHRKIEKAGQSEVLRYWNELDHAGKCRLASQLAAVNFDELPELIRDYVLNRPKTVIPPDLAPASYFPLLPDDMATRELYNRATATGEEMLRQGRVCCLTVAGGQGTRLGFDGPKGTYPIGPVSGKSLFGYFAESIRRFGEKYGKKISWYIMTSLLNCGATTEFFKKNGYFGLEPEQVFFFTQGTMPAIGYDGKLLLSARDSLALSPDGHGGTLLALRKSGALSRMEAEGTDVISYFQVDNPLVKMCDPLFVGLHALEHSEMSSIMLAKTGPFEKLGNFCVADGRLMIIEYSDLPDELAEKRDADGKLAFLAGSPAIHMISRDFVASLTANGVLKLPWHRADKSIPALNDDGILVKPQVPNGVKLESFIFDALPLAKQTMILEGDRSEVFAPTKNATGVDSVESCRQMLVDRDARRLEKAGVEIPRRDDGSVAARIEISPAVVVDDADAVDYVRAHQLRRIEAGAEIYLQ